MPHLQSYHLVNMDFIFIMLETYEEKDVQVSVPITILVHPYIMEMNLEKGQDDNVTQGTWEI
jgi:hypothetical protein